MITFCLLKHRSTSAVLTLLLTLQITACGTEDFLTAVAPNIDPNAINEIIRVNNSAALISGVNSGSVIKNSDPDGNGLLEVTGELNIIDIDDGEATFIANTTTGNYGSLTISTNGNWSYAAANNQTIIQNLTNGAMLTDRLTISSADGTISTITISILDANENNSATNFTLSWVAPAAREDNSALSLSAIAGYKIYYGTAQGQYSSSSTVNDGSATGYTFNNFASSAATYYFVITTIDTDGRESQYSSEVTHVI